MNAEITTNVDSILNFAKEHMTPVEPGEEYEEPKVPELEHKDPEDMSDMEIELWGVCLRQEGEWIVRRLGRKKEEIGKKERGDWDERGGLELKRVR